MPLVSWDILVLNLPLGAKTPDDIADGFEPGSIGRCSDIVAKIKEVVPTADFSDPSWGLIETDQFSLDVSIDADGECEGFAIHIRDGDMAPGVVAAILERLNLRAIDTRSGGFFEADPGAIEGFRQWRARQGRVADA